ncbi:hypothetical protein CSC2_19030 [Clostridium zeae]|uniref:Phosphatase PAP2 family protein n=1 Tax=Clostridium zeae TaxID=2759022 RepID=A0ABQ1E9B7_9CLOT|nr:VTT domain-containing protein [Clostridium zeae]GFZ31377.1 hypothetical protein CSC2_19030 [Clostridium zeae]
MQYITGLLDHYGYIVLLVALVLELIAFPLPGELLMTYCGFLVNQQKLNWFFSITIASIGAIIGVTISYFIGNRLGVRFFKRYGHFIHLGPRGLEKTSVWFNKYGNRLLIISYFIPGVRHITGYFSGITEISYKKFALNSYIGAILWSTTFISLGKLLGTKWERYHRLITQYLIIGGLIISIVIVIIYLYKSHKQQIIEATVRILRKAMKTFNSFGKIKAAMLGVAVVFIAFFALLIGVIEDFLSNEFNQFDTIASYLMKIIFTENWRFLMSVFYYLTSLIALILVIVCTIVFIMIKGIDKFLEIRFAFFTILGGEALQTLLRLAFKRMGPFGVSFTENIKYTFPSEQSLMAIVAYGFVCFLILRHTKINWLRISAVVITIVICLFSGISVLFYQVQYPSDIYAGYVFGVLWLTLNIILLECYRILPKI